MSCGTDVISMYIFIQFMENIPLSLDESAIIDGANYWQIYWKIMLPLLKPAIVIQILRRQLHHLTGLAAAGGVLPQDAGKALGAQH